MKNKTCPTCLEPCEPKELDDMKECMSCVIGCHFSVLNKEREEDNAVLSEVKKGISSSDYESVITKLKEPDSTFNYCLVNENEVSGEPQDDIILEFGKIIVNQTGGADFSGDDQVGDAYIPIGPNLFFKFSYAM